MPSGPQGGAQTASKGLMRASCSQTVARMKSIAVGGENPARKLSTASYFSETFWELCPLNEDRLFDYSEVDFSFANF